MVIQVRVGKIAEVKEYPPPSCVRYRAFVFLRTCHITNTLHFPSRIARTAGGIILSSGGVIRGITNWGPYLLAKPKVRSQVLHDSGHHFIMRFDCSPKTQELVRKTVAIDPRMLRCGVVKLGSTLKEIMDMPGHVAWSKKLNP